MRRLVAVLTTAAMAFWLTLGLVSPAAAATLRQSWTSQLWRTAQTSQSNQKAQLQAPRSQGSDESEGSRKARVVQVTSDASGLHFSRTRVPAGTVRFKVSTSNANGANVTLFQLRRGVTFAQLDADLIEEFGSNPAKGTRDLIRDVRFFGLADVQPGTPATVTERLKSGTYYAFDTSSPALPTAQTVLRFQVVAMRHHEDNASRSMFAGSRTRAMSAGDDESEHAGGLPQVLLTSSDRFVVRGQLPATGSVRVKNVADTIHFMEIVPVADGTTDAQVQAFLSSGNQGQPPFARNGPSVGMDVLSPGKQLVLGYSLPKGTYVLLCFIADDQTGMPHAVMGMHKVVTLR